MTWRLPRTAKNTNPSLGPSCATQRTIPFDTRAAPRRASALATCPPSWRLRWRPGITRAGDGAIPPHCDHVGPLGGTRINANAGLLAAFGLLRFIA
jgi:hypothetical protein